MLIPNKLKRGDCVALIAPSSSATAQELQEAIASIEKMDLVVKVYDSCRANHGHLSGVDALRADDVNRAFLDDDVKGIICLRGGYGTPRILDRIDYRAIASHPKLFLGYSDITALHSAINNLAKLITLHGPMPAPAWVKNLDDYTKHHLERALFETGPLGEIVNPPGQAIQTLVPGAASGQLVGGNLSLLSAALGSKYAVDTKGKILFIEDVDESVYRVDGMLSSLRLAGKLSDAAGIVLGTFSGCNREVKKNGFQDLELLTVFQEIIAPLGIPTVYNFRAGHNYPQPTLPLGVDVTLDATAGRFFCNTAHNQ